MRRKIFTSLLLIILISGVVAYAAIMSPKISLENSRFETGSIKISLNDGKPVIDEEISLFEPGMKFDKEFFIRNDSSMAVYYRFYFNDNGTAAADDISVKIKSKKTGEIIYDDTMSNLNRDVVKATDDLLGIGERRDFIIYFKYLESGSNKGQGNLIDLGFTVEATQAKNNPDKSFN